MMMITDKLDDIELYITYYVEGNEIKNNFNLVSFPFDNKKYNNGR